MSFATLLATLKTLRRSKPVQYSLLSGALVLVLTIGCAGLVFYSGGTSGPFPHLLYVPIGIAAYFLGLSGGIGTAVLAGLAVGPLMPLNVETGEAQATLNWLYRLGFYLLTGLVFGSTASLLRQRSERLEAMTMALRETQAATLKAFSSVMETHDDATAEHCERVALNARKLGVALALSAVELNQLYWAGILHDVGKVAVPTRILEKTGPLSTEEYELIKLHPAFGAGLLRSIGSSFEAVATGVESHHECWNGNGYPNGNRGKNIPLFGRILAIVDSFEAMTADRPYRDACQPEAALIELRRCAGEKYDAELVALFERLYWAGQIHVASRPVVTQLSSKTAPWLTLADN